MLNYKLKVGVLSIRRLIKEPPKRIGMFQSDYAIENKEMTLRYLRENYADADTEFVDIEFLNEEGLLRLPEDCPRVIEYFKHEQINALFIVNCNFGEERVAAEVASALSLPTLLWGPRDRHFENGKRYTDTQCGLFAISKGLKRNGVSFSYIENCDITAPAFDHGLRRFLGVACMVNNFKKLKILSLGARLRPFKSIMYNELELCERFGVDVITVNLVEAMNELKGIYENEREQLQKQLPALKQSFDVNGTDDDKLLRLLATVTFFERMAAAHDTNIIGTDCWSGFAGGIGVPPCLAMSLAAEKGILVTCEGDIFMSITNALLLSATRGKGKPLQGEFTARHPDNENAELLWHCGPFPASCAAEGTKPRLIDAKPNLRARDGVYTLARFQAERGKYYLLAGTFHTCEGPETFGTYLWAEFKDLPRLERKLIEGPYIHHVSEIYGDFTEYLREFCRMTQGVEFDPLEN